MGLNLTDLTHLHLLLNHIPTIGMVAALALFLLALVAKSDDLKRAALGFFVCIALLALPTYTSGNAAAAHLADRPEDTQAVILAHQTAALRASLVLELTGLLAWVGLWQFRRRGHPAAWVMPSVLFLALVTFGLMAQAANIAGEISHTEIRAAENGAAAAPTIAPGGLFDGKRISKTVKDLNWIWAASETVHFFGLATICGVVLLINLRILGFMKGIPFSTLHALLPWGVLGFALNLFTGMTFFVAAADQYIKNPVFHWKIVFLMLVGANALYLTVFDETWKLPAGANASVRDRAIAGAALAGWFAVIYCGDMLPFLGNAF